MKFTATDWAGTSQPNEAVYNTGAGGENDFADERMGAQLTEGLAWAYDSTAGDQDA